MMSQHVRDDHRAVARVGLERDTGVHESPGIVPPDYVRLAYERIERTDEILARIEQVLVTARRALDCGSG